MTRNPNDSARTYHAVVPDSAPDPLLTSPWVQGGLVDSMSPAETAHWAGVWSSVSGRLVEVTDLLRRRIAPALAEAWSGEAAAASQAAFQKLHATARSLSITASRMSGTLRTVADRMTEVMQVKPSSDFAPLQETQQAEWNQGLRQLESFYAEYTLQQMPTAVSANLPDLDEHDGFGGYGRFGGEIGGVHGLTGEIDEERARSGYGMVRSSGSPSDPEWTGEGAANHPLPDGRWDASASPSVNGISGDDGYVPVGSDTELAGLDGSQYSGGGFGSAGYAAGGPGSSGFGSLPGPGFGAGGPGGVPGFGGVPGVGAGAGGNEAGIGRGGSGLGGRGAPGTPTGGGGMAPPMSGGAGSEDEEERERDSWLGEDAEVWRSDDVVSPAVIGQVEEEQPERPERRRRRRP